MPFSDSVVRVCRLGKHSLTIFGHFGQTRIADVFMVALAQRARFLRTINSQKRSISEPPVLFQVFAVSGSGVEEVGRGREGGGNDIGFPYNVAFPLQVWRSDATTVTVFMLDGAVSGQLLELTTWDKFERDWVCWSNMWCRTRLVAGVCSTKSEELRHWRWTIPSARRSSWQERCKRQVGRHRVKRERRDSERRFA